MDRFTKEAGEVVHLRASTKFNKKDQGTLFCTNLRLVWVQIGQSEPSLHFHLSDIKTQFVSTQTSAKALLRLSVKSAQDANQTQDFLFEFIHGQNARKDLNQFRDRIAQVVKLTTPPTGGPPTPAPPGKSPALKPSTTTSTTSTSPLTSPKDGTKSKQKVVETYRGGTVTEDEVKQRVLLLSSNEELKQLFEQLVSGGVISEADFWESRKMMLKTDAMRSDKQPVGMPSMLLADVRPAAQSNNVVTYKLTPTIIKQIFIQHPSVERAYKDNVPIKITEQQFWKKFVQSKNFHRDRNPVPSDDLFAKYDTADDTVTKLLKRKLIDINPLVDISNDGDEDTLQDGYGVLLDANQNPDKLKQCLPLLRRFNRHSALVLGSKDILNTSTDINNLQPSIEEKEKILKEKKKIIGEHAEYEELMDQVNQTQTKKLRIQDQKRYFEGHSALDNATKDEKDQMIDYFKKDIQNWNNPSFQKTNIKGSCQQVLDDIMQVSSNNERQSEYVLPESQIKFKTDFLSNFRKSNELLRHFWASSYTPGIGRPPSKQQIEKNNNLHREIDNLYESLESRKKQLKLDNKTNQVTLIAPIQDSLNRAIMKYQEMTEPNRYQSNNNQNSTIIK